MLGFARMAKASATLSIRIVPLLFAAALAGACFGCGDDDDGEDRDGGSIDAGRDAATDDERDADVASMDARVADGSDEDASDLSDAGDSGDHGDGGDGGACLESSYIWGVLEECFDELPLLNARRVTLAGLCADFAECPVDWNAALAAAAECDHDGDAGSDACWTATTECGANLLRGAVGPDGMLLYFEPATGALIGAAVQLTDIYEECVPSEVIAGERPPRCCEEPEEP